MPSFCISIYQYDISFLALEIKSSKLKQCFCFSLNCNGSEIWFTSVRVCNYQKLLQHRYPTNNSHGNHLRSYIISDFFCSLLPDSGRMCKETPWTKNTSLPWLVTKGWCHSLTTSPSVWLAWKIWPYNSCLPTIDAFPTKFEMLPPGKLVSITWLWAQSCVVMSAGGSADHITHGYKSIAMCWMALTSNENGVLGDIREKTWKKLFLIGNIVTV